MNSTNQLLGTNLSPINYYSSQLPFLSEFKSSQSWITQNQQTWNTNEENLLDLDSNGWVRSLPFAEAGANYTTVGSLLFRGHNNYLPGRYVVLYDGAGEIEYKFDATKNEALSNPGRDVVEVNPSEKGIFLNITETDPNRTGNYIRNIKIVHEDFESIATTETYNPEFLDKIQPFNTLRFMDWMETNGSKQEEWSDRPKPEAARYSEVGVPVEIMVELANQTNANPWFTMPHLANDGYIRNFARYVQENLQPNLEVYVEYSNEVWNRNFEQSQWVERQAQQEWSDSNLDRHDWYSKRTTEVVEIWDEVFAQDSARVIGVMSAQATKIAIGQQVLDYNWSNDASLSHSDTGIDAIAIAPYFGRYIGEPENEAELKNWLEQPDGGLNKLFQEITQGGLLPNSPEGGALAQASGNIKAYAQLAEQENLPLLAYEGGQHLVGIGDLKNSQDVTDLLIAANRAPRMGEAYEEYLSEWFDLGGDLFLSYNDIEAPARSGSWGALEYLYQDGSPKYNALVDGDWMANVSENFF
ncbi:cellulose-binding protein [Pleurocapsales cyanobacterium LEGE 10410]|nr:cellulose-binding protein [Pleurocapsales cyanobacterium LEGE 10410]